MNACCDVVNRGVAVWEGKVFVGTIDGRLIALDAATGKSLWDVNTIDQSHPYTITGAPRPTLLKSICAVCCDGPAEPRVPLRRRALAPAGALRRVLK